MPSPPVPSIHGLTTLYKAQHSVTYPAITEVVVIRYNDKSVWTAPKKRLVRHTADWGFFLTYTEAVQWLLQRNNDMLEEQVRRLELATIRIENLREVRTAIERMMPPSPPP